MYALLIGIHYHPVALSFITSSIQLFSIKAPLCLISTELNHFVTTIESTQASAHQ